MSTTGMQTNPSTIHGHWNNASDAVTLIDAHHHLWDLRQNKHPWLCGAEEKPFFMGDYGPLKRNYLPEDYRRDAGGHNVLTTIHCEAEWDRSDQVGETRWISQLHAQYGFPGAIVAHAWFDTDNAEEVIAGLSWDLRVPFWHLDEAAAVARAFPKTPIVLNHT